MTVSRLTRTAVMLACFVGLSGAFAAQETKENSGKAELEKLRGVWKPSSAEYPIPPNRAVLGLLCGKEIKEADALPPPADLEIAGAEGRAGKEAGRGFKLVIDPSKQPKAIDFVVGKETFRGIYEQSGDELRIGFVGDGKTRPERFEAVPDFLSVRYKRQAAGK